MNIVYHCYGGAHSSVTAACIHVGRLPEDSVPGRKVFWNLPIYDSQEADEHGHIYFVGVDQLGNKVYVAARRSRSKILKRVFAGLAGIFKIEQSEYVLINLTPTVNLLMRLGGYLSRRWGLIRLGRPIVILGTQLAYRRMVMLVDQVRKELKKDSIGNNILQ